VFGPKKCFLSIKNYQKNFMNRQALLLTIIKFDRTTGRQKDRKMKIPKDKNMKRQKDEKTEKFERLNCISANSNDITISLHNILIPIIFHLKGKKTRDKKGRSPEKKLLFFWILSKLPPPIYIYIIQPENSLKFKLLVFWRK